MVRATPDGFRKPGAILFQLLEVHVAQSADAGQDRRQPAHRFFTFGAPTVVFAGCQFMFHHRVRDHQLDRIRKRNQFVFEGTTIQE